MLQERAAAACAADDRVRSGAADRAADDRVRSGGRCCRRVSERGLQAEGVSCRVHRYKRLSCFLVPKCTAVPCVHALLLGCFSATAPTGALPHPFVGIAVAPEWGSTPRGQHEIIRIIQQEDIGRGDGGGNLRLSIFLLGSLWGTRAIEMGCRTSVS